MFSRSTSKGCLKIIIARITADADLDGWKLTEIHKDRVLLKQGSQQKELLLRKPKSKDLSKKANVPRIPNAPNMPNIPNIPQPAEGEFENSNEITFKKITTASCFLVMGLSLGGCELLGP